MEVDDPIFEEMKTEDDFDKYELYKKAGKLAAEVREKSKQWVKIGTKVLDIAEKIESEIGEEFVSFPTNISINENAAHSTPDFDEETVLTEDDVVCIDIGTQVEGFVGDTAYTVDFSGEYGKLIEASEQALQNSLSILKHGINTKDIGAEIEKTIKEYGFKPVENLGGHGLDQYQIHAHYMIPNIKTMSGETLEEGDVFAIEPFATTGSGRVREGLKTNIFSFEKQLVTRNKVGREVLNHCIDKYKTTPFAERWLTKR